MKFGVCRGLDDFAAMDVAKECGIDYFETGFGCLADYTEEKFNQSKQKLNSIGLACTIANGFIPGSMKLVGDSVDYEKINDYLDRGFERAKLLGVKTIVLGSGAARSFEEGFSSEKAKEQLAFFLSEYAAPKAQKADAVIVIEPLRFCESSLVHTVADGLEIARMSGADNVFGLADLYHVYGNNDSISNMMNYKSSVLHSHIAEPVKRGYPKNSDCETVLYIYREFIKTLEAIGCQTCSIEARTDDFNEDIKEAISLLKTL